VAKTYAELKTALGDWLGQNALRLPLAVRGDILNIAQRELCRMLAMRYNEVSDTFVTMAGTRTYALPATWSRPYELWYLDSETDGRVDLAFTLKEEFDWLFPDATTTAKPTHYTVWGGNLFLGATPDRVLTITRDFYAILPDLVADNDTNGLTTNAWEAVLFKALADASRYGIEDARIPLWKERATELETQLLIEHARARTSGRRAAGREPG
jgi:hypothetical protein